MNTIVFCLLSRFPTEKAYGVTTELSGEAAKKKGFNVCIVTPKKDNFLGTNMDVYQECSQIYNVLLSSKFKKFIFFRFLFFIPLFSINIRIKYSRQAYTYWVRDPYLAYWLKLFSRNKVVLEIHRSPKPLESMVLKILRKNMGVLLAPISIHLRDKLQIDPYCSVIAPMSIRHEEIIRTKSKIDAKKNIITYLGNKISGNYNLNINIINELAKKLNKFYPEWKIEVIGISKEFVESQCRSKLSDNITICGRIPRNEVFSRLRISKIGLVVYPNENYFIDSFPIKIVEYAAAKLAIVASDTVAHRNILDNDKCLFFKVDSITSLFMAVEKLIVDELMLEKLSMNAFDWAHSLTYEDRVKKIIENKYFTDKQKFKFFFN